MQGSRSSAKAPVVSGFSWRLAAVLWPFATGAVAINLFLAGLIGTWIGLPALSPLAALAASLPFGLPATWAATRWVQGLIRTAEAG